MVIKEVIIYHNLEKLKYFYEVQGVECVVRGLDWPDLSHFDIL